VTVEQVSGFSQMAIMADQAGDTIELTDIGLLRD
jgi:hypothetical protein